MTRTKMAKKIPQLLLDLSPKKDLPVPPGSENSCLLEGSLTSLLTKAFDHKCLERTRLGPLVAQYFDVVVQN